MRGDHEPVAASKLLHFLLLYDVSAVALERLTDVITGSKTWRQMKKYLHHYLNTKLRTAASQNEVIFTL